MEWSWHASTHSCHVAIYVKHARIDGQDGADSRFVKLSHGEDLAVQRLDGTGNADGASLLSDDLSANPTAPRVSPPDCGQAMDTAMRPRDAHVRGHACPSDSRGRSIFLENNCRGTRRSEGEGGEENQGGAGDRQGLLRSVHRSLLADHTKREAQALQSELRMLHRRSELHMMSNCPAGLRRLAPENRSLSG